MRSTAVLSRPLWSQAVTALACSLAALDAPALSFSSSASVGGWINTSATSPILGTVNFTVNGPSDYSGWFPGQPGTSTGVAKLNYQIAAGQTSGLDPIYDIVTSNGKYGLGYTGQAQVQGLNLKTAVSTFTVDGTGTAAWSPDSQISAQSSASWAQELLIAPTAHRAAGSYGAIIVGFTLDGHFPGEGSALANVNTSFTDAAGVSYSSSFGISTWSGDTSWTGSKTVYKKLLFQYGTVLNLSAYQWAWSSTNGSVDFFNTGKITQLELPLGATLQSGAEDAGLGTASQLFGSVTNATSVDDPNTNWDFGNNGGGFTPPLPVPEPASALLLSGGLGLIGLLWRRRMPR